MVELWSHAVDWVNAFAVTPFFTLIHLNGLAGDPRGMAAALLIAMAQVAVIGLIIRPLAILALAEPWQHRRYARIDRTVTLVMLHPNRRRLHNHGRVVSLWDVVFGTAPYGEPARQTGIGDPMVDSENERGLIAMQRGAFRRFWGAPWTSAGWRRGDVAFDENYRPTATAHVDLHRFDRAPLHDSVEAASAG